MNSIMGTDPVPAPAVAGTRVGALRGETRALLDQWRSRFVPRCDAWARCADLDFSRALAARGLLGLTWPAPYGRGASHVERLAVTEELLRAGAPVAAHWIGDRQIGPALLRHGSPALQAEFLPRLAAVEATFALGMSEPEAGSDLAAVRTRAVDCEGGYRITGRKIWTSGAHLATHLYVLARTTPLDQVSRRHEGLSEFLVDMDSAGIVVSAIVDMAGEHHYNEVTLDDVAVPTNRLIGEPGAGWAQVTGQLAFERGGPERFLSTYPLLRRAMREPVVAADAGLRVRLGELIARLCVLRRLCRDVAIAMDGGAAPAQEAATTKLLGTRFEHDVIDFARAVVGAGAEDLRADTEAALFASPGFGIRGGAADVLLAMISKADGADRGRTPRNDLTRLVADLTRDRDIGDVAGLWETVGELGLDRIGVPEAAGGPGGTLADLATVVTELAARGMTMPIPDAAAGAARAVLPAAAAVGAARGAYALTSTHLRTRQQFGRPLIELPLVAASLAEMRVALLQAQTALDAALEAAMLDAGIDPASSDTVDGTAEAARIVTAAAATTIAARAHQLHGAIGTTGEYALHHLTKALWAGRDIDVPERDWAARLGARAVEFGENWVWDELTAPGETGATR